MPWCFCRLGVLGWRGEARPLRAQTRASKHLPEIIVSSVIGMNTLVDWWALQIIFYIIYLYIIMYIYIEYIIIILWYIINYIYIYIIIDIMFTTTFGVVFVCVACPRWMLRPIRWHLFVNSNTSISTAETRVLNGLEVDYKLGYNLHKLSYNRH